MINWHTYELRSHDENNRRFSHLDYGVSFAGQVYAIRRATLRRWDYVLHQEVQYPYSLSNLVGLTLRHHRITGNTLRHIICDQITNRSAWQAMKEALRMVGVLLPSHPGPMNRTVSVPEVCVRINAIEHPLSWLALHLNNPLTRMLEYLLRDERIVGLGPVMAYSIIVIPKAKWGFYAPQEYWSALVAHF